MRVKVDPELKKKFTELERKLLSLKFLAVDDLKFDTREQFALLDLKFVLIEQMNKLWDKMYPKTV